MGLIGAHETLSKLTIGGNLKACTDSSLRLRSYIFYRHSNHHEKEVKDNFSFVAFHPFRRLSTKPRSQTPTPKAFKPV